MGSNFMQQFLQGFQMGQSRNENTRRDQELMMERQRQEQMLRQRAEEFDLQKEEFAVRRKQLAAQEAAHKLSAAQEARKLREEASYLQGMPAPTAAEAGIQQTTPQDVGPTMDQINVPQPTQAMPDPTGGADIQMPVLTGRQQMEMEQAEKQRKMREALGLLDAQEGIKAQYREKPEDNPAAWKQQGDGTYVNVLSGAVRGRPDPTRVGAGVAPGVGGPGAPPAEAGGGIPTFGTAKSEAERKAAELAWGSVGEMPSFVAFVRDNSDIFGPAAGRATKLKQSGIGEFLGMDSPRFDVAEKQAEFAIMRNNMVNALSGAAVSPAEFERLKEQIPELTDPPTVVAAKLKVLDKYFSRKLQGFGVPLPGRNEIDWSPFGGGGKTAPTAPTPTAPAGGGGWTTINGVKVREKR